MPYLFTRSVRVSGNLVDSMGWSAKITEKVNQIAEIQGLAVAADDVAADQHVELGGRRRRPRRAHRHRREADGRQHLPRPRRRGRQVQRRQRRRRPADAVRPRRSATVPTRRSTPSIVRAVLAPGVVRRGRHPRGGDRPAGQGRHRSPDLVRAVTTGTYGEVAWISLYDSIEQVQAAEEAIGADPDFARAARPEGQQGLPAGQATQTLARKLI